MLLNARLARRTVVGAVGTGAVAGAMFAASPSVPADRPPNYTAGDLAQVRSGVSAGTSVHLFCYPWVNDFFTSLKGQPRDEIRTQVQDCLAANPQDQAELQAIHQPLVDLRNRCGTRTNVPTP
jgi:hemophore-related protein